MFLVQGLLTNMDTCHFFPQCMLAVFPLTIDVTDIVVTRACTGYQVGLPLCFVIVTALSGAVSAP